MFRIGDILFNENLGYDSNWNMKTSINSQIATLQITTKEIYLSGRGDMLILTL